MSERLCEILLYLAAWWGYAVAQLVEALCYKPESRGFDSRRCQMNFSLTNPLGSTQQLTELSTRNISCGVKVAGV
jgi:hypothetical protein